MKRPVDRLRAVGDEGPQLAVAQDASRGYGHPGMALFFDACTTYPAEAFLHTLTLWAWLPSLPFRDEGAAGPRV